MLKNLSFLLKSLLRNDILNFVQHDADTYIYIGVRRETFECLHQGIGQQFDIDAGKVFVL